MIKKRFTDEEKLEIISYCKHDVWASMMFYKLILKPFVATKLLVGKIFGIPLPVCYTSTNAILAAKALKAERKSFTDTDRQDIEIPAELKQYITYSLPSTVVNRLCSSPDKFEVALFDNTVSYSNGGIHSVPTKPDGLRKKRPWFVHVKTGNGWSLINVDGGSFYPNVMVNLENLYLAVYLTLQSLQI